MNGYKLTNIKSLWSDIEELLKGNTKKGKTPDLWDGHTAERIIEYMLGSWEAMKIGGNFPKEKLYGLTSQLRRVALSIPTNIVEGYSRKGDKELALKVDQGILLIGAR